MMAQTKKQANLGIMCLVLAQTMVGINIVFAKLLIASVSLPVLLGVRFILASLMLLPLHWLTKSRKTPLREHFSKLNTKDYAYLIAQAICAGSLFNFLMFFGLKFTDANLAGIITSALPAIIAIMAWIILDERFSAKKLVCVAFATLGLALIAADKLQTPNMVHSFFGDFVVFVSLFPEALYYILCKLHPNKLPVFLIAFLMNAINTIIFLVVLSITPIHTSGISLETWVILVLSAISSGLFYVFWLYGSKHVDGMMASLSTAIMPVVTVLFAWIILKENLSLIECSGMTLVIFSIIVYAKR
jgi:drug/metabolite transporter (DMT)-like permease